MLKAELGKQHHIHMYTSIPFELDLVPKFAEAGLDEIRFHLLNLKIEKYLDVISACSRQEYTQE